MTFFGVRMHRSVTATGLKNGFTICVLTIQNLYQE